MRPVRLEGKRIKLYFIFQVFSYNYFFLQWDQIVNIVGNFIWYPRIVFPKVYPKMFRYHLRSTWNLKIQTDHLNILNNFLTFFLICKMTVFQCPTSSKSLPPFLSKYFPLQKGSCHKSQSDIEFAFLMIYNFTLRCWIVSYKNELNWENIRITTCN